MTRPRRALLCVAALAVGGACTWLGLGVMQERSDLGRAAAALASPVPASAPARGGVVAQRLLGSGSTWQADDAAVAFERIGLQRSLAPAVRAAAGAEARLLPLATAGPGPRRSWAATLLAAIEFQRAQLDRSQAREHVARSLAELESAVAADPANEDAKIDLELLLSLQHGQKQKQQSHASRRPGSKKPQTAKPQASASPPGSGW